MNLFTAHVPRGLSEDLVTAPDDFDEPYSFEAARTPALIFIELCEALSDDYSPRHVAALLSELSELAPLEVEILADSLAEAACPSNVEDLTELLAELESAIG